MGNREGSSTCNLEGVRFGEQRAAIMGLRHRVCFNSGHEKEAKITIQRQCFTESSAELANTDSSLLLEF